MKFNPEIFREYDIRGVVDRDYDETFAYNLGRSHATFIFKNTGKKQLKLSVGYDARLSSPKLAQAVVRGFVDSGATVFELGLVTTPISYYSTFHIPGLDGGIMITGSHNPPEYNGFKISLGKTTIFGEDIQKLKEIMIADSFLTGKGSSQKYDILTPYVEQYKKEFENLKSIPFVLDCANGAAGSVVRRLFEACGLMEHGKILFEEPDGRFPNHHPDPTVEKNLVDLKKAVKETKARVGIGFDGDADRIGVVDYLGNTLYGDELMALISRDILSREKGSPIIGDVKCSDRLYNDIKAHGGEPIMWKTGHSLIKHKIKEMNAPFGGEMSGHIFFNDRNYGYDDAIYAGLRVIEILSRTGKQINELLEGIPSAYNTPELRIDTTEEKKRTIVEALKEHFKSASGPTNINYIDGIRVSYVDGWGLARASNTQPVLVLRFESTSENGLARIRKEFEDIVNKML